MANNKTDVEKEHRVTIFIPYVEGEDPIQTVGVNGTLYQIRKGHMVDVLPEVAQVIANSNQQMMESMVNRKKFESQRTDL